MPECKYKIFRSVDSPGLPAIDLSLFISITKCFSRHSRNIPRTSYPSRQSLGGLMRESFGEVEKIRFSSAAAENDMMVSKYSGGHTVWTAAAGVHNFAEWETFFGVDQINPRKKIVNRLTNAYIKDCTPRGSSNILSKWLFAVARFCRNWAKVGKLEGS